MTSIVDNTLVAALLDDPTLIERLSLQQRMDLIPLLRAASRQQKIDAARARAALAQARKTAEPHVSVGVRNPTATVQPGLGF